MMMNAIVGEFVVMMINATTTNTMTTLMLNNDAHCHVLQPFIIMEGSVVMMIIAATANAAVTACQSRH